MTQHQDRDTRREQILDAATRLFISKGYENSTVDEIAEEAKLSKGSIYWYFKSKIEILFELTDRYMTGTRQKVGAMIELERYGAEALYKVHREVLGITMQSTQMQLIQQMATLAGTYPEIRERFVNYHRLWDETISTQVQKAVDTGQFHSVNAVHVAQAIHALYEGLCNRSNLDPDLDTIGIIETVTRLMYEGLTQQRIEEAKTEISS